MIDYAVHGKIWPAMRLYVTGGRERKRLFKDEEEWKLYDTALILQVNADGDTAEVCVDYVTPVDARAGSDASVTFKAGAIEGNQFYTCTSTEVLVYSLTDFRLENYISLPYFNDCHHVCPSSSGNLLVTSTGLDLVVEIDSQGCLIHEWSTSGTDPWQRFSRAVDYRKVLTTKPHKAHPNFAFCIDDDVWATRMIQRDALCLTRSGLRIPVGLNGNHDGLVHGDHIYFTTVDGTIVVVCRHSLETVDVVDLNIIHQTSDVLGWCRGLLVVEDGLIWIGFTRVRKTKFWENVKWIKHGFQEVERPTRIALYDIKARTCLKEINLEPSQLNVLFGIYCA